MIVARVRWGLCWEMVKLYIPINDTVGRAYPYLPSCGLVVAALAMASKLLSALVNAAWLMIDGAG